MRPWSMNEVMMLGILVALIKIAELATVEPVLACMRWARWSFSFRRSCRH